MSGNDWSLSGGANRQFPHASDAEEGMLGCCLISPEVIDDASETLCEEHFWTPAHGRIWRALQELRRTKVPIDLVTLTASLADSGELEEVGGAAALARLLNLLPTAANWPWYRDILVEKWMLRKVIETCEAHARRAYSGQEQPAMILDSLQSTALSIGEMQTKGGDTLRQIKPGVLEAVDRIEKAYANRGRPSGLDTGFYDLNRMTSGLHPGQMIIIAGRPSMGKTAMGVNIAENVAFGQPDKNRPGHPVAIFSLEMSYVDIAERILCGRSGVNIQQVRDGFLATGAIDQIVRTASEIAAAPIYIDETAALTINEFRVRARRAVKRNGVKLVVVDYVGLMRSTSRRAQENRQIEMSEISAGIKATAKELQIPIIVLAQLNRNVEDRKGSRPQLSDLRESGSLEQDADLVGLLYREEYYKRTEDNEGMAELIIAKQRNGPVGPIQLGFIKELTKFTNVTPKQYSNRADERQQGYQAKKRSERKDIEG